MDVPTYDLPEASIAQTPIEPRDAARLLVSLVPGTVEHRHVRDLPTLVGPGDVLVVNSSKVMPARLHLTKRTGGAAEVLLLEPEPAAGPDRWLALVRPGRRLPPGTELLAGDTVTVIVGERADGGQRHVQLVLPPAAPVSPVSPAVNAENAENAERRAGRRPAAGAGSRGRSAPDVRPESSPRSEGVDPEWAGDLESALDAVDRLLTERGEVPLPPYIHEPLADPNRYQTVYADRPGSVAAPTAGLHLTPEVLDACRAAGATVEEVDLAVGLGTFRPVTAARAEDHDMHEERYRIPASTMDACREARRVVAIGTTTTRALETAAATGELEGRSKLFIHGDFPWRVVDVLMTNFHQPHSTLLLLVESFYGPGWRDLYAEAVRTGYRFLSFGDAMVMAGGRSRP